ncbi:MAG: class I mannose-6-phosphate isomerase [Methylacidiphilales bacterium]|nr:class I mannose-6-phosphate isomerase [Candidatus Methylacidiphilales bacterium]MDW8348723.1 class I mannose-6-phosphate isomerase [Verrucomicrobiae bacterium]
MLCKTQPIIYTIKPILKTRIWGGRKLADWGRSLPDQHRYGESWELVDRSEDCSELYDRRSNLTTTLHELWETQRTTFFGTDAPNSQRFPILIKLLDCADTLSVQVHPPENVANALGGEPKTELWYFLETQQDAKIYVGLKKGVTRAQFQQAVGTPNLPHLLHSLKTSTGEAMFLPSGRVHAIGAGNFILEIQQNSDTTYRVDDWQRRDSNGNLRELHVEQALKSIHFDDYEPTFVQPHGSTLLNCPYFKVERFWLLKGERMCFSPRGRSFYYQFITRGQADCILEGDSELRFGSSSGDAWLLSASAQGLLCEALTDSVELITVSWGS